MIEDHLRELYQEVILDHGKNPRNFRRLNPSTFEAAGHNPLCGDRLTVFLLVDENETIEDITFEGRGCAISIASASMMTEILKGKSILKANTLFEQFHSLCTNNSGEEVDNDFNDDMEKLRVLSGVRQFPMRVKCATLSWHAMVTALKGQVEVTTE